MTRGNWTIRALAAGAASTIALATLVASTPAVASTTSQAKVSGYLSGFSGAELANVRVMLMTSTGTPIVAVPRTTAITGHPAGEFAITVPRNRLAGSSLQLLRSGRYFGPVTLAWKTGRGYLRFGAPYSKFSATTVLGYNVGRVNVDKTHGFAKLAVGFPNVAVDATHPRSVDRVHAVYVDAIGKPVGAGNLGKAKKKLPTAAARAATDPCPSSSAPESGPGGDCDGDGVPNAVDVDDNGNGSLDMTDPASSRTTATLTPWSSLFLNMSNTLNANIGTPSADDLSAAIGGENVFGINFFTDRHALQPTVANPSEPDAVWVDCGSIAWCGASNGTAVVGGASETPGFVSGPWKDFHGEKWVDGVQTVADLGAPFNGLIARSAPGGGFAWFGGVQPRDGSNTLTDLVPGQMYNIRYKQGATTGSVPMTLAPVPLTVPTLKGYSASSGSGDVDYTALSRLGSSGNRIVVGGDGKLTVTVWRPQRLALPSETGTFRDIGHLQYGLILTGGSNEFGCDPTTYYSGLQSVGVTPVDVMNPDTMHLWPLTDSTDDAVPAASRTMSFTVDVRQCLIDHDVTIDPSGNDTHVTLTAAGAQASGGSTRAAQMIELHVDPAS